MSFGGKYKLESTSNMPTAFKYLGFPEADIKRFLDPKNEIIYDVRETSADTVEYDLTHALLPEWNASNKIKIGEVTEFTKPFPHKITVSKISSSSLSNRTEMMGKTLISEQCYSSYGMTSTTKIEGSDITFSEVYKRITPKISGYYIFESETGLDKLIPAMGLGDMDINLFKDGMAFSINEKDTSTEIVEYFGKGDPKRVVFQYGQEIDYEREDWNVSEKKIVTKLGPGIIKTVSKSKKNGIVYEYTMSFNDKGVVIDSRCKDVTSTEYYRRGIDVAGTWRTVSCTGAESHGRALGMTGAALQGYVDTRIGEMFSMQRLPGGAMKFTTNSPWFPNGEMLIKSGEQWTVDIAGLGKSTGIGHEGSDEWIQASKMNGKTISQEDKFSGDFLITTAMVDGCKSSAQVTIMVRD